MKENKTIYWFPIVVAVAFLCGMFIQTLLQKDSGRSLAEKKFSNVLNLIDQEYVDPVNIDSILEATLPSLLVNLDPHSVYIPASDFQQVNDELEGSFSGVGVQFVIESDTILVVEALSDGPSERVGIKAGDRIIKVDDQDMTGPKITSDSVFHRLRGESGSHVKLTVKRRNVPELLEFDVVRGEIPVKSIVAQYMLTPEIGYIKVDKFGRTTYNEFFQALCDLRDRGAESFVVDLRDNLGGLLETAVLMANEFLPAGKKIVETKGRHSADTQAIHSDGFGSFKDNDVVVLLNEYSASSSEIFAGALQDNDRGLIIGRRSFGKGLVQHQIELPDHSAVRLTVARYYTPSGRCIQRDYSDAKDYENDIFERYERGEIFAADSIHFDESLRFTTSTGRTVYGGGGITPDIFVPIDTARVTHYYTSVFNSGLAQRFAIKFVDNNREEFADIETVDELLDALPNDDFLLRQLVTFCAQNKIPARWYYINISRDLIVSNLKAIIARELLGQSAFYEILNESSPEVNQAIDRILDGSAEYPITTDFRK